LSGVPGYPVARDAAGEEHAMSNRGTWSGVTAPQLPSDLKVVALAGGVGGAKLVDGLAYLLPPSQFRVVVNTGDDFEFLGLTICPDLDTVMYTLAGVADPGTGWGIEGDTHRCLDAVARLGGAAWFRVGDRDLATHLLRTERLRAGERLTEVTRRIAHTLGVHHPLLPMADVPVRTVVITEDGELPFQTYFVKQRYQPVVRGFRWEIGASPDQVESPVSPEVSEALAWADVVVLCPSNPFVSIDPILTLPGVREVVQTHLVVAVSPIIGGEAVKGPAAKMFRELEGEPSALAVAMHYGDLVSGWVIDRVDAGLVDAVAGLGKRVHIAQTMMSGLAERISLARDVLTFASELCG
jgi:LPPG:FO 2-phospho-L-lactate transferase